MKIISIEASIVTQWPHWIQSLMIASLLMVLTFNLVAQEDYRRKAMLILGCFICYYSIRSGFLAQDIAVGIFFGIVGLASIMASRVQSINPQKLKHIFTILLLFLIATIMYFKVFSYLYFKDKIYINQPFRLYFSGLTLWSVFSLATLSYVFWRFKSMGGDVFTKIRFALNTVVLFFWITFFSVSILASWGTIGKGANTKFDKLTEHIYYGFGVDAENKYGSTHLLEAIKEKDIVKVKALVKAGADVNKAGGRLMTGKTPLMRSVIYKQYDIFQFLIENGANINAPDENGFYPIHTVNKNNEDDRYIKTLLEHGANIHQKHQFGGQLIHLVAESGKVENNDFLEYLISKGADINAQGQVGTPLHHAVFSGNIGSVKKLIALGADPNIKNKSGRTPKEMALHLNKSNANQNFEIAIKKRERRQEIIKFLTSTEIDKSL